MGFLNEAIFNLVLFIAVTLSIHRGTPTLLFDYDDIIDGRPKPEICFLSRMLR